MMKYRIVRTLKEQDYKKVVISESKDKSNVLVKIYSPQEKRLYENELKAYQRIKEPHLKGFP